MSYNNIIVETGEDTMSIITVVVGSESDSHLVNDYGTTIAVLDPAMKQQLVSQGVPEKVVYLKK